MTQPIQPQQDAETGKDPSNTPVEELVADTDPDDDGPTILMNAYGSQVTDTGRAPEPDPS